MTGFVLCFAVGLVAGSVIASVPDSAILVASRRLRTLSGFGLDFAFFGGLKEVENPVHLRLNLFRHWFVTPKLSLGLQSFGRREAFLGAR